MKIDFSKLKLEHTDGKNSTFRHPAGHMITINHKGLSPDNLKALNSIAEQNQTQVQAQEAQNQKMPKAMAEGGQTGENAIKKENTLDYKQIRQQKREMNRKEANQPILPKKKLADGGRLESGAAMQQLPHFELGGSPAPANYDKAHAIAQFMGEANNTVPAPTNNTEHYASEDTVWPSPSTTPVGKAAAAAEEQRAAERAAQPQEDAEHQGYTDYKAPRPNAMASGGKLKMYADPKEPVSADDSAPTRDKNKEIGEAVGHAIRTAMSEPEPLPMPSGGPQPQAAPPPEEPQDEAPAQPEQPQIAGSPMLQPGMPGYAAPQAATNADQAQQPDQSQPDTSSQDQNLSPKQSVASLQQPTNKADATSPMQMRQNYINQVNALPESQHNQMLQQENSNFENDLVNGHITPMTYKDLFGKQDTLGKIGTLFGLLVSGAGAGLAHQPNAVMEMMNNEIKNDLEAQMKSKENAQNFLRINQAHLMNKANISKMNVDTAVNAYALTQANELQTTFHHLVTQTNKLPDSDPSKQRARLALAALYPQMQNKINNINDLAASAQEYYKNFATPTGGPGGSSNEQAFQDNMSKLKMSGPEGAALADYRIQRHIPGVPGEASRPIPEDKRNLVQAQTILDDKGKQVLNYVKAHRGTWKPNEIAKGEQMVDEMKNFYNSSIEGGALTEGRLDWYDRQFGTGKKDGIGRWIGGTHPTDIFSQLMGSTSRMQEMVDSNSRRRDLELRGLGFPVNTAKPGQPSTSQTLQPHEGQEGTQKGTGKPVIFRNGKWYLK